MGKQRTVVLFLCALLVFPLCMSVLDAGDPSLALGFQSPLPPPVEPPVDVPPPVEPPVEPPVDVQPPEDAKPPVFEEIPVLQRHTWLSEKLDMPLAAVQHMPTAQLEQLVETNAKRLGVNVYRLVDGEMVLVAGGRKEQMESEAAERQREIEARQGDAVNTVSRAYMPLIAHPPLYTSDITTRIDRAYSHLLTLYDDLPTSYYAYQKEYQGYPLWLKMDSRIDWTYPRMIGHYATRSYPFGKITWYSVGIDNELSTVTFEEGTDYDYGEPTLYADRYYNTNGQVGYQISIQSYGATADVDLYLGASLVADNLHARSYPVNYNLITTDYQAAHRYTVKHAMRFMRNLASVWGDTTKTTKLDRVINYFQFTWDIYNPLFALDTSAPDDFVFQRQAYRDCDFVFNGVSSTLFWGGQPYPGTPQMTYYPYEPKECTLGIDTYITLSRADNLVPMLQAIHILNKYGNPDRQYVGRDGVTYTTPRQVARWVEGSAWNGHGIAALGKPIHYSSGMRSTAFMILETLLGYKYGDTTSRTYADSLVDTLIQVQWGSIPFAQHYGATIEEGLVLRPQFNGGALVSWTTNAPRSGKAVLYFEMPPRTFLQEIIDMFNMPAEVQGVLPTNTETTGAYAQALRVYLRYKFGVYYPNSLLLP